jgi:hypothetical protein
MAYGICMMSEYALCSCPPFILLNQVTSVYDTCYEVYATGVTQSCEVEEKLVTRKTQDHRTKDGYGFSENIKLSLREFRFVHCETRKEKIVLSSGI